MTPNQITGPNAGGPRQLPVPTPLTARVGQFCRSAAPGNGLFPYKNGTCEHDNQSR